MNRQRGQNSKASCVFFVLCSGEVPACHTTDIRDRIGIYSDRNHPIVHTTKEVPPLPRSFSPALPSQAPFSAALVYFGQVHAGTLSTEGCCAVPPGSSSARASTEECPPSKTCRRASAHGCPLY